MRQVKASFFLTLFVITASLISIPSKATTLDEFSPRPITGYPWSDAWYYYINDPQVGYFKIVFLTFLNEDTPDDKPHSYLHVVYAPADGSKKREYDYYYEDVDAKPVSGPVPWSFQFNVADVAKISEQRIELNLPDVSLSADFSNTHRHYSNDDSPGASPFGWVTSLPFVENQWFVFSMATATDYHYKDAQDEFNGKGLSYIDRGWNSGQAAGMIYLMAVAEDAKFMFSGGVDGNLPIESWAGRLITEKHDLTFTPSIKGMATSTEPKPCDASMHLEMNEGDYRVVVDSSAPLDSFYNHVTPSLTVFKSRNAVMKSMQAATTVKVYHNDELTETIDLKQSVLEFGGIHYCDKLLGKGNAKGRDHSVK